MGYLRHLLMVGFGVLFLGLAGLAQAQLTEQQTDFYERWLRTADRAEEVVDRNRASSAALENLRSEIGGFRDIFNRERSANSERIKTLESQLEALGPPPDEGAGEASDIAALRTHLESALDTLRVPRIISEEAYNRATGLISEIDRIVRDRQTRKLLARGPSPLNPAYWTSAGRDIETAVRALINEIRTGFGTDIVREQIRDRAPAILVLTLVGLVLIARGRTWSERAGNYLRAIGRPGHGVWTFVVSLFRIILPWIGVVALVLALGLTDALGLRGELLLEHVPFWAATILYFDWISRQLFAIRAESGLPPMPRSRSTEVRALIGMLAVMLVLFDLVILFEQIESISEATRAVAAFPVILMTALLLLRLQRIAPLRAADAEDAGAEVRPAHNRPVRFLRRILLLLGIFSPVLAAFGYVYAAEAIVFPIVRTLALFAVIAIIQRFLGSLYGLMTGKGEAARDSLFTVIAGLLLCVLALPVLALIWGMRSTDLWEFWDRFLEGFTLGGTRISPTIFATFAIVFTIGYLLTRLLQGSLRNSVLPKTRIDPGGQNAIVSGTGYVGIFLAAVVAITSAGLDLSSLAIVAGALSVGIGFGLQTIVSNFVSGIILLIERPISKGDWIDVNGQMGYVRDISVRSTRIETFDRTDVIVPNSDLISGTVTNYTRGNTVGRVIVPVGVAYGTDPRRVEKILGEIANAHPMVLGNPPPNVVFQGFGADSLDFEIRAILRDVNWVLSVKSDMNYEIARRFAEEDIEIPFAQRDVWLRNPEALPGAPAAPRARQTGGSQVPAELTEADLDGDGGDDI